MAKEFFKEYMLTNTAFWVCLGVSIVLLFAGALTPPLFVIEKSILISVSELFGFAALATIIDAIRKGVPASISHGQTTVSIGKDKDGDEYINENEEIDDESRY